MSLIKISIYTTSSGKKPFIEWHESLDRKIKAIISIRIDRIEIGNFGDCKLLKNGNGIFELRIDHGPGYRVYFGKIKYTQVILLVGGDKARQSRDIVKAKQYWKDYKESNSD